MPSIEILVSDYYDKPEYFAFMPGVIFDALELAFLKAERTAFVPLEDFEKMIFDFSKTNN